MLRRLALAASAALVAPLLVVGAHAEAPFRFTPLTITAPVAPEGALGATRCAVDADLYTPRGVDARHPAPAILITHGYGGSKADMATFARAYVAKRYVVLAYTGLGLGAAPQQSRRGSDCKITFNDRDHDGLAGSALVDFLGGGRRADDGTRVDYVTRDRVAHDGHRYRHDPRVGMFGVSYGGAAELAVAAVDPRVDTIVPTITWNDLSSALSPNATALVPGTNRSRVPGTAKIEWNTLFVGQGLASAALGTPTTDGRAGVCPGFYDPFCQAFSSLAALGYADRTTSEVLRNSSVSSFADKVRVPVLLMQGQADTLFPLREAIGTYRSLRSRKVPVKMVWHSWGHDAEPLPTEFGYGRPDSSHQGRVVRDWFGYWLKGVGSRPRSDFSWFRPWAYRGDAARAYASAPAYPLPGTTTLYASGTSLVRRRSPLAYGTTLMTAPGAVPMSSAAVSSTTRTSMVHDTQGTSAGFTTSPLRRAVDVVGAPTARLWLGSTTARPTRPEAMLVAFVKLYDVAPDGSVTLPHNLVAPIRVSDLGRSVDVALPAIVHRFAKGHRIRLVVSLSDVGHRGNTQTQVARLSTSQWAPSSLTLPGRLPI